MFVKLLKLLAGTSVTLTLKMLMSYGGSKEGATFSCSRIYKGSPQWAALHISFEFLHWILFLMQPHRGSQWFTH